ncbi:MAG: 3-oxoacyl-[acyl-carrier-protein] reductase [Magnetococcales bacterium]|nr:3-oxoacyl-[acyl-carrier-protein] reductase [Magnetococcales bacterium]MBF0148685.1 3-oxoacyl-[acyl-carrier-protein] reductase [Magnetococcales bacterium]MBF0347284.1 3-oxoacyl-[acyl-carrier-protein] reductase [Magnetococcales bacterium]
MMEGRVAIVTGSSSGIGRVIARQMAARKARLMLISNEPQAIMEALAEVRVDSPDSIATAADVTNPDDLTRVVDQVMDVFGRVDILVNNAGITRDNLMMRMKDDEWDSVLAVNLTSIFRLTRMVIKHMMKARYGRIVNIASVVGLTGNPGQANYAASKAGLIGLTKSLAAEVASRKITANCVAPGFIRSAMTDKLNLKASEAILSRVPMGEMGTPEDVANAVCFLASDSARYITGETLHVNGGMYMG